MSTRREFLQHAALLGATATLPINFAMNFAIGQENVTKPVDPLFTVPTGKFLNPKRTPRKITIPNVGNFRVLKGDFHIHTLFSDGYVMPKDRVHEAVENGLDVIAITDHIEYRPFFGGKSTQLKERNDDHNIAYDIAKPEAEKNKLILIRGTEITKSTMPPGHFNAVFLKDVNPVAEAVNDWKKMLEVAANQGAFVFWNHPGWVAPKSGGLEKGVPMSFTAEHEDIRRKGFLHGIEVFNGTSYYPIVSDWCNEMDMGLIATSDIHVSEWNMYGSQNPLRPITLILAEDRTEEAIREAFFARRTVGWAAGMILGRPQWVEQLFNACVGITKNSGSLQLKNKSDIPCRIQIGNNIHELKPQSELVLTDHSVSKKLTVTNWLVGTAKPLEISIG
ncbi:MAG: PHP domain-containing protein [Planctomycetaceae bacterium]|jgi:predicted metal-dependent phosphoesterase TrpH|nr:PHP domain-containing protein [Planctomycetaceae bacterium]